MMIESPVLPYNFADLEPVLSRDTLMFHFLRHQRLCYDRLATLIHGTELAQLPLEQLIRRTERIPAARDAGAQCRGALFWSMFWSPISARTCRCRAGKRPIQIAQLKPCELVRCICMGEHLLVDWNLYARSRVRCTRSSARAAFLVGHARSAGCMESVLQEARQSRP